MVWSRSVGCAPWVRLTGLSWDAWLSRRSCSGPLTPAMDRSLEENGVRHKSLLRFETPGLDGFNHSAS